MKKILSLLFGFSFLLTLTAIAQDLDEILENHFEAVGQDKLLEVNTFQMKGKSMNYGMESDFTIFIKRPAKFYLEVPIQGNIMKQAYDGENAWMIAPWTGSTDPQDMTGPQKKGMKMQADFDGQLYNWKEKGYKAEYLGTDDMEGTEVYKIRIIDEDGDEFIHFIDSDSFVILKMKSKMKIQGNEIETETFYSNFKPIEGIIFPFNVETKFGGQTNSNIIIEEIILNPEVDDSIFEKPKPAKTEGEETEDKEK